MKMEVSVISLSGGLTKFLQNMASTEIVALSDRRIGKLIRQHTTYTCNPTTQGKLTLSQVSRTPRLNAPMIVTERTFELPEAFICVRRSGITLSFELPPN